MYQNILKISMCTTNDNTRAYNGEMFQVYE